MTRTMGIAAATFALVSASATVASAQAMREGEMAPRGLLRAPMNALEIQVGSGFTQGFGGPIPATRGSDQTSLGGPGAGGSVGFAFRANPYSSVGVTSQFQRQTFGGNTMVTGSTIGVNTTYHAAPYERLDPWFQFGAGYRMLLESPPGPGNDSLVHGFQIARATAGVDIRVGSSVAVAPTVGADLSMFLWRNPQGRIGNQFIDNPRLTAYLFAGLAGRFDLGGQRVRPLAEIIAKRGSR